MKRFRGRFSLKRSIPKCGSSKRDLSNHSNAVNGCEDALFGNNNCNGGLRVPEVTHPDPTNGGQVLLTPSGVILCNGGIGPDVFEGPHSKLKEDEFFDAMESALDAESENEEEITLEDDISLPKPSSEIQNAPKHRFSKLLEDETKIRIQTLSEPYEDIESGWYLVYEDDEALKVYRKEIEIDGIVCDPLRATHRIDGVSGREVCHYFFDKDVRLDWEVSVEKVKVVEKLAENANIQHQYHKRIWPSSQRDSCFLSHIRTLSKEEEGSLRMDKQIGNAWFVMNHSLDHPDAMDGRCVRAKITASMLCQTITIGEVKKKKYTRENIGCQLTYVCQVNPGGWAPPSVVRQVSKREYPKFLRKFSEFMQAVTKEKPLLL